ncbi:MAG: HAD family hydrolase [Armatimonadetes bacterium]|nr:HAD family hydrolase [Armatimonadota bacterium]
MPPARAVCFDLGGVLIQIHEAWDGALAASGVRPALARAEIGSLGGFSLFDRFQRGEATLDEYLPALAEHLGGMTDAQALSVHQAILRDPYPGADRLVQDAKASGAVVGCLSNTNEAHWATFFEGGRYGFGPLFSVRIGSHIVRSSKPDAAMYRAFESGSGLSGGSIVYFDDGRGNVEAALGLGWQAHLVDALGDTAAQIRGHLDL